MAAVEPREMSQRCSIIRQQFEQLKTIHPQIVQKVMQDQKVKNVQRNLETTVNEMEQEKKSK